MRGTRPKHLFAVEGGTMFFVPWEGRVLLYRKVPPLRISVFQNNLFHFLYKDILQKSNFVPGAPKKATRLFENYKKTK